MGLAKTCGKDLHQINHTADIHFLSSPAALDPLSPPGPGSSVRVGVDVTLLGTGVSFTGRSFIQPVCGVLGAAGAPVVLRQTPSPPLCFPQTGGEYQSRREAPSLDRALQRENSGPQGRFS